MAEKRRVGLKVAGVVLLVFLVAGAVVYQVYLNPEGTGRTLLAQTYELTGFVGSEKANYLENPDVQRQLLSRYGIDVNYRKAGSIEMIDLDHSEMDYLWPSSRVASELFKTRGGEGRRSEITFFSPIVFYSWTQVTEKLIDAGLVSRVDNSYYVIDLPQVIDAIAGNRTWADIGVDFLRGPITVLSTDPTQSNSGNLFAGLVANVLNSETVVSPQTLPSVLNATLDVFRRQGLMEHSTGTLFERYLTVGMGQFPLIVGYENQIVEFRLQNPDAWQRYSEHITILYPQPTVYSEHVLIALTDDGERLVEAFLDPQDDTLLRLAWEQHGFRGGLGNDPSALGIDGIAASLTQITQMPTPEVMETIIRALD